MISSVVSLKSGQQSIVARWCLPANGIALSSAIVCHDFDGSTPDAERIFNRALTSVGYSVLALQPDGGGSVEQQLASAHEWLVSNGKPPSILLAHSNRIPKVLAFGPRHPMRGVILVDPPAGNWMEELVFDSKTRFLALHGEESHQTDWLVDYAKQTGVFPDVLKIDLNFGSGLPSAKTEKMVRLWAESLFEEQEIQQKYPEAGHHVASVHSSRDLYYTSALASGHPLVLDEPPALGGLNLGPTPMDVLLASLGACTAITVRMYASRKEWPLEDIHVELTHALVSVDECEDCNLPEGAKGRVHVITRNIQLEGPLLTEEMKSRMMDIADKCPVHRTISDLSAIKTKLVTA